jgi:hypothetical protein
MFSIKVQNIQKKRVKQQSKNFFIIILIQQQVNFHIIRTRNNVLSIQGLLQVHLFRQSVAFSKLNNIQLELFEKVILMGLDLKKKNLNIIFSDCKFTKPFKKS